MNWYIGQDIVAIVDHEYGEFEKGETFVIKGLKSGFCKCTNILIDIGKQDSNTTMGCPCCGTSVIDISGAYWFSERRFAPLDTLADITELTEHLSNTTPFQL
jgi:hypothetical protein